MMAAAAGRTRGPLLARGGPAVRAGEFGPRARCRGTLRRAQATSLLWAVAQRWAPGTGRRGSPVPPGASFGSCARASICGGVIGRSLRETRAGGAGERAVILKTAGEPQRPRVQRRNPSRANASRLT